MVDDPYLLLQNLIAVRAHIGLGPCALLLLRVSLS